MVSLSSQAYHSFYLPSCLDTHDHHTLQLISSSSFFNLIISLYRDLGFSHLQSKILVSRFGLSISYEVGT